MCHSIPEKRLPNNLPAPACDRPSPKALAIAMLARRHRIRGAVAVLILELAGLGREVSQ